ncbi:FtsK/SpoIIIE domain-containing protein [Streptomyces sp. NPDC050287]|uniref:FtsK/SpoIIIE domain-containing protein n=1 Tax=Streptomyces sp. NPDC050287 TaxID=3365608 RepID=UPI003795DAF6
MQIRLTVVDPQGPPDRARGRAASCDVLVTAPAGTALAAVASALASAVSAGDSPLVLYAGGERLDDRRCTLGEPPLIDGAVLSLGTPGEPEAHPELDDAPTQLHVIAGPDAGGVHLLHGGQIHIGRSADADVPLDDPDVSRLHCAVTVAADGQVSVADLNSTNGTTLDGTRVSTRPVRFAPGALLRLGESALRLTPAGGPGARVRTAPDGEGHVRVPTGGDTGDGPARAPLSDAGPAPSGRTRHGYGPAGWGASAGTPGAQGHRTAGPPPAVPGQGGAPHIETEGARPYDRTSAAPRYGSGAGPGGNGATHVGPFGVGAMGGASAPGDDLRQTREGSSGTGRPPGGASGDDEQPHAGDDHGHGATPDGPDPAAAAEAGRRKGTPLRGTDVPVGVRRRGGLSWWARRLTGGRGDQDTAARGTYDNDSEAGAAPAAEPELPVPLPQAPETWPDPAALLLTALGPGPRLWERGPGHPEALTVRLGTADRAAPDGSGLLPAVPVTADLREVGALGLAGPRARLTGLARAVVAQLAALHSPETLEIVLISTDRSRPVQERTAEWSWLGWLPHLRPAHGQDCRLLLAYDREQATARTDELLRRLEDHLADAGAGRRAALTGRPASGPVSGSGRRPSWARDDDEADASGNGDAGGFPGPYTVVVVDGDPGGAAVREAVARLALEGPRAGIHVVCLAETAPASPASPVTETYEAACAAAPAFRDCGAVALLSGDVATALRLMRVARTGTEPAGGGRETSRTGAGSSRTAGDTSRSGTSNSSTVGHTSPTGAGAPGTEPDALRTGVDALRTGPGRSRTGTAADSAATGAAHPHPDADPAGHGSAGGLGSVSPGTSEARPPAHGPVPPGTVAAVDAVSPAWAERFARALAPLRAEGSAGERHPRVSAPLPQAARLLDELGLARATPASLMARWADAADDTESLGGRAWAVLGAGPRGPVCADLATEGPHLLIEGPSGSGRTELLRAVVASLAAAERPDRLSMVLIDGRDSVGTDAGGHGEGLRVCTDVPHVTTHLTANDPVRMREFAQSLSAELKRRAELLGRSDFAEWHTGRELTGRLITQRTPPARGASAAGTGTNAAPGTGTRNGTGTDARTGTAPGTGPSLKNGIAPSPTPDHASTSSSAPAPGDLNGDLDSPPSSTLRLRPAASRRRPEAAPPLPRLVVVVDDLDLLVSPALGSPGRPAAGSVIRALEAVAREGERLGVHLVSATGAGGRTAQSEPARRATLRVTLDAPVSGPDEPAPGRGRLAWSDGRVTAFQAGRVTGRIPRTATLRPTVVPLEWERMGDPPARRPVRELGNGPTDLALLASALERAAREVAAKEVPSLL